MHSRLTLATRRNAAGQTVLGSCFYTPPIKILTLPNTHINGERDTLAAIQMSSSPGLLAGDTINIDIHLTADTRLKLFTQAFTRIQAMPNGGEAQQHIHIQLDSGSRLYYLPHPLVLHTDAALTQNTEIALTDNCILMLGEIIACGRVLNGEYWHFRHLSSHVHIHHNQRLILADNTQWQPQQQALNVIGQMEHFSHQACLYYVHTGCNAVHIRELANRLHEALLLHWQEHHHDYLWGVSQASSHALCLRALALQAQTLQQLLEQAAAWLRRHDADTV
ncbi:urease accessory protein UreD [Stenoxybacter acetivorans]|uniref:urease accessory protein UreD n=1 Tax=Stenoxybacter acetivorans TaxID=422441 RepID=UPI00055D387B|nr:urease accessory protein UreD [Stenoxybacter acetivorans]